eukprot:scaffold869_cov105-Isochrysis_galbana.AAC.5
MPQPASSAGAGAPADTAAGCGRKGRVKPGHCRRTSPSGRNGARAALSAIWGAAGGMGSAAWAGMASGREAACGVRGAEMRPAETPAEGSMSTPCTKAER